MDGSNSFFLNEWCSRLYDSWFLADWGKAVFIVFIRHLWRLRCGIMGGVVHLSRYPLT